MKKYILILAAVALLTIAVFFIVKINSSKEPVEDFAMTDTFAKRTVSSSGFCGDDEVYRVRDNKVITTIHLCEANITDISWRKGILTVTAEGNFGKKIVYQEKIVN